MESQPDHLLGEGMICIEFHSAGEIRAAFRIHRNDNLPVNSVTVGWH